MPTRAEIAAQSQTLTAVFAVADAVIKPQTNVAITQFNDLRRETPSAELDAVVAKFTALSLAITAAKKEVAAQIAATNALVPSDPIEPEAGHWWQIPSIITLLVGKSISIAEYYSGPAGTFRANGLPPGVTMTPDGTLTAAADAPESESEVTFDQVH